jgi:hypothetical protein
MMKKWNLQIGEIGGTTNGQALPTEANKIVADCVKEFGTLLARRLDPIGLKIEELAQVKFTFDGKTVNLPIEQFAGVHVPA